MTELALRATGVGVVRGGRQALIDVDMEAHHGRILSVIGPNGAGKSTLLKAVAGLMPCTGSVTLEGQGLGSMEHKQRARTLAYVPQRSRLDNSMSVEAVVSHGRYAHRGGLGRLGEADHIAMDASLTRTNVEHLRHREFDRLSYGEQRRVLLARALATGARVLLLDEPTASLDISHTLALYGTLRELANEGKAVVVVLHELDHARRFTDDGLLLHEGRCVNRGAIGDVVSEANVRRIYGVRPVEGGALGFELDADSGDPS